MVAALPSFIPCGCCSSFFHSTAPRQQPLLLLLPSSRASPGSRPPVPPPAGSPWHGHAAQRLLLCLGVASPPCYLGPISCAAHHPPARRRMALGWTPQPCRASRARHGMLGRAVLFDRPAFQARFGPPFLPCLFSLPHVVPDRSCLGLIEKSTVQLLPLASSVVLPVVDLASSDLRAAAKSIRQACVEYGFFYVANHGIEGALMERVFAESKKFFELPMEEKMALRKNSNHRGYTAPYSEKIDASSDLKESFYIGPMGDEDLQHDVNQWPSEERFLCWKETMKLYRESALATGKRILSLIALSLDLDAEFFQDNLSAFLRLLHYSGDISESNNESYGAAAHSDYGMITLLATDGTPGLQVCREKDRHPQLWEDVHHIDGALIVNIGDLLERWTNCVFRSTLHRVVTVGKERCSMAFFIDPNPDLVVKCLESCCSEAYPPRFPPIRSGDYLEERFRATYKLATV